MKKLKIVPIIIAALVNHGLGFAWYAFIFGERWATLTGTPVHQADQPMLWPLLGAIIFNLLNATGIAMFFKLAGQSGFSAGLKLGAVVAVLFALPMHAAKWLWQGKLELFMIDGAIAIIGTLAMSVIISAWQKPESIEL